MKSERRRRSSVYSCSFCGKSQDQVQRLVAGPGYVYVCDGCFNLIFIEDTAQMKETGLFFLPAQAVNQRSPWCSFCGKSQNQVRYLAGTIRASDVRICDECVALCREIVEEERSGRTDQPDRSENS